MRTVVEPGGADTGQAGKFPSIHLPVESAYGACELGSEPTVLNPGLKAPQSDSTG
jgi:hypothetical protein